VRGGLDRGQDRARAVEPEHGPELQRGREQVARAAREEQLAESLAGEARVQDEREAPGGVPGVRAKALEPGRSPRLVAGRAGSNGIPTSSRWKGWSCSSPATKLVPAGSTKSSWSTPARISSFVRATASRRWTRPWPLLPGTK
jgi:hypothetical protein